MNGEWISTKDKLPEKSGFYLVYLPILMETCFYSVDSGWQYGYNNRDADLITHWMELPEPPEESGGLQE